MGGSQKRTASGQQLFSAIPKPASRKPALPSTCGVTCRAQQRAFDRFRREYNEVRSHEALGMQTPASVYVSSPRIYPGRACEPEYDSPMRVRRIQQQGPAQPEVERGALLLIQNGWSVCFGMVG